VEHSLTGDDQFTHRGNFSFRSLRSSLLANSMQILKSVKFIQVALKKEDLAQVKVCCRCLNVEQTVNKHYALSYFFCTSL